MAGAYYIYGHHSVVFALKNPQRIKHKLWVTAAAHAKLKDAGLEQSIEKIPTQIVEAKFLDGKVGDMSVHQGCVLACEPLPHTNLQSFLGTFSEKQATFIILDHVMDPQNVGAILRTAAAFQVGALIVHDRHSPPNHSPSLIKAACGAVELVPVIRVANIVQGMEILKEQGFWCIGLSEHAQTSIKKIPHYDKKALVLGSEGKGVRSLVNQRCDLTIKLPTNPVFPTLNVSVATAVALTMLGSAHE